MAEYVIVAKIDPSGTTAGAAAVKQNLSGIDTASNTTTRNLDKVGRAGTKAGNDTATAVKGAATAQTQMEAATRRVLQAVDQEAAEQMRLNALLRDAEALHKQGAITQGQLVRVQKMVVDSTKQQTNATAMQRMGMQQLGFQLGDVATMYNLGAKPAQIFASQIGQVTQAVQLMAGGTSKFASFIGGPWGIALSVGLIMLSPFVAKLFEGNDALGEAVKKMKEDAKETEINRQAKEAFNRTLEGQIALQRELNKELTENLRTQQQIERGNLAQAYGSREGLYQQKNTVTGELAKAREDARRLREIADSPTARAASGEGASVLDDAANSADRRVKEVEARLALVDKNIALAERTVRAAEIPIAERNIKAGLDESAAATERYTKRLGELREQRIAGKISDEKFHADLRAEEVLLKKTTDAIAARKKAESAGDGVSRFKTQKQAIGVAGRELQRSGLRVSENEQFGGVTPGAHKGKGHGLGIAIDADVPNASDSSPTAPDIKSKYDIIARRYAARGYIVLWAGNRYDPSGAVTPIRSGDKHFGHMHIEAPGTIIGEATNASGEAQATREAAAGDRVEDRQAAFMSRIIDQADTRGRKPGVESSAARDEKIRDDWLREFKSAMPPEKMKEAVGALDAAEAREQALRFDEAYVAPLRRLQDLQGKTGLDREILNAQLEEASKKGEKLSWIEKVRIGVSMKMNDQMQREAALLEDVNAPLERYRLQVEDLNRALAKKEISQDQFNSRLAELNGPAAQFAGGLSGTNAATGQTFADIGARAESTAVRDNQLAKATEYEKQLTAMGISQNAAREAIQRDHQMRMAEIDRAGGELRLASAQDIAGSLTSIAETGFGKQSGIFKAMFAIEKAVAIARSVVAIQSGIAQAAATGPFPANLGAIASVVAATASIVSNIAAVSLNFRDGGKIRGPGGPRDDKVRINASDGEFMVNAAAVARPGNEAMLEAINRGSITAQTMRARTSATMAGGGSGSRGGDSFQLNFGDVVVHTGNNVSASDGKAIGRDVRDAVRTVVREEIAAAKRPGGSLTKTVPSVMT